MKAVACVVNWNTAEQLPGVITSLMAQPGLAEIVVIDNASHDGSADLAARYPDVRVVRNAGNRGFAGAANQGVAWALRAEAAALLVCNPDVRLEPGYVERAVAALAADPRRASVAGRLWRTAAAPAGERLIDSTGHLAFRTRMFRNRGEGQVDRGQFDASTEVFGVSGAAGLYRVEALQDAACAGEVFDEHLFAFWEDVDLDWRLRRRGWHAWYQADVTGWHERGGAGPRRSAFVEELNFANRFLVLVKNDEPRLLARDGLGVGATSVLKAGELALTVPGAFLRAWPRLATRLRPMIGKRREIQASATMSNEEIIARWFEAFDYGDWVATWWRRVRREAAEGSA